MKKPCSIYAFVPAYQGVLPPPHDCVYRKSRKYLIRKFGPKGKMLWEKAVEMPEDVLYAATFSVSQKGVRITVKTRDSSPLVIAVDKDGREAEVSVAERQEEETRLECRVDGGALRLSREKEGIFLTKSHAFGKEAWKRPLIEFTWWQRGHGGPFGGLWMSPDGRSYIHSDISHKEHLKRLKRYGRKP